MRRGGQRRQVVGLEGELRSAWVTEAEPGRRLSDRTGEDDEHVFAALRAGARGYLVKGAHGAEIVRAVQSVASGEAV